MANYATTALTIGSNTYVNTLPYAVCDTAANTSEKVVTVGDFALEKGATINVKFSNTNTADSPTLKVNTKDTEGNIVEGEAKDIYYKNSTIPTHYLKSGCTYTFVYNGNQWDLVGYSNSEAKKAERSFYYDTMCDLKEAFSDNTNGLAVIPDNITNIGSDTVTKAVKIVVIPDSVTSIEDFAFENYKGLTRIEIPDGVTYLGGSAFASCSDLTSVVIGDGVTRIGSNAFLNCGSLTSVAIGKGVTSVGDYAFHGSPFLTNVYITDIAAWCNISFGNYAANPLYYANNLYLNDKLVTEVIIPNGAPRVGDNVFYDYDSLTSVIIPDSVTSIGEHAFYGCSSLTSVVIGNGVTTIGNSAFASCSSLANITIPDSVTSIGDYAFSDCSSLTSVVIPDSVTSISRYAFDGCTSLTSVVIPDSVTSIGSYAFENCSSLTSVYYKGTEDDWKNISIGQYGNFYIKNVARYYYSETDVSGCWHYDANGQPVLW